jgi:hypothetical protein
MQSKNAVRIGALGAAGSASPVEAAGGEPGP